VSESEEIQAGNAFDARDCACGCPADAHVHEQVSFLGDPFCALGTCAACECPRYRVDGT
jgi:hypothetical protein